MEKYDLYITNPISVPVLQVNDSNSNIFFSRGWKQMDLDLEQIRTLQKEVLDHNGRAYIVPAGYRTPLIEREHARTVALTKYDELTRAGKKLDPLSDGYDDILWWTFEAEDPEAISKEIIPGRIAISIDKLDGHIRTKDEFAEWVGLQNSQ
jgi:hypothetical protein